MLELTTYSSLLVPRPSVSRPPNGKPFHLEELLIKPKRKHKAHKNLSTYDLPRFLARSFLTGGEKKSTASNIFLLGYTVG